MVEFIISYTLYYSIILYISTYLVSEPVLACRARRVPRAVRRAASLARPGTGREVCPVAGGATQARRDSLEFGGGGPAAALQEYAARKWGPSPLSPPLGAALGPALGPVGLRPVSAAPGAETAKYRCPHARDQPARLSPHPFGSHVSYEAVCQHAH